MNQTITMTGVLFEPDQLRRYKELEKRKTIRGTARRIAEIGRDLAELRRMGDDEALCGATLCMQQALMALVAIPARTIAELEHKQRIVMAHEEYVPPDAFLDPQIGAALLMDYELLDLTPAQRERMRDVLQPVAAAATASVN